MDQLICLVCNEVLHSSHFHSTVTRICLKCSKITMKHLFNAGSRNNSRSSSPSLKPSIPTTDPFKEIKDDMTTISKDLEEKHQELLKFIKQIQLQIEYIRYIILLLFAYFIFILACNFFRR